MTEYEEQCVDVFIGYEVTDEVIDEINRYIASPNPEQSPRLIEILDHLRSMLRLRKQEKKG